MKLTLVILIFLILWFLFKKPCDCNIEKLQNTNQFQFEKKEKLEAINENNYFHSIVEPKKLLDRVELSKLLKCQIPIALKFEANINHIINTGSQIYQDILQPHKQKANINKNKYNLMKIIWQKSKLNWYNEEIPLEIILSHVDPGTGKLVHIIFPLKLVDRKINNSQIENFHGLDYGQLNIIEDMNNTKLNMEEIFNQKINNINDTMISKRVSNIYNKLSNINLNYLDINNIIENKKDLEIDLSDLNEKLVNMDFNYIAKQFPNQKFTLDDINSFINLNKLLENSDDIPAYKCCSPTIGRISKINLCSAGQKVLDQGDFYYTGGIDGSLVLITKPQPYSQYLGYFILDNLVDPERFY